MSYSYLASPYTNPDDPSDVLYREQRFQEVCAVAAELMSRGICIFCPISHSHPISAYLPEGQKQSHEFWLHQDFALLEKAEKLYVVELHQWERSYGISKEIDFAIRHGIPVEVIKPRGQIELKFPDRAVIPLADALFV